MSTDIDNTAELQPASAEIIPFPRRMSRAEFQADVPPAARIFENPPAASERLQNALASLIAAQAEQKAALEKWRSALGDLQSGVQGLGQSLRGYVKSLSEIAPAAPPR